MKRDTTIFNLVSYRKLVPWGIVFFKSIIFINSRPTCGILIFYKEKSLKKLPNQPRVKEDALNRGKKTRRGVRCDAKLSCSEIRFQKCSQSGKKGSKHPMLSISMAFNVISCKKVERNTQKLKIADFTM